MKRFLRGCLACASLTGLLATPAYGRDRHVLWTVVGQSNTVYLLGSIHLLRAADGGLPAVANEACNLTGSWVAEQHVVSTALNTDQNTTTWYYYEIEQTGDTFTMTKVMNCGLVVDGTTTVTLGSDLDG